MGRRNVHADGNVAGESVSMIHGGNMNSKKITVVTVCMNAEEYLRETIESVLQQRSEEYEYLIVDGVSTDSTLEIAYEFKGAFEKRNVPYRIISEPDQGIYDAMNKAASLANGQWVIFMNAGDTFFNSKVLQYVSPKLTDSWDLVYGDILIHENGKYKLVPAGKMCEIDRKNPVHHQAAFTRTELLRKYRFDTSYKIVADYDFLLRLHNDHTRILRINYVIASFLMGGVSNAYYVKNTKEMDRSRKENHIKGVQLWKVLTYYRILFFLRDVAKLVLGKRFYSEQRGWFDDRVKAARRKFANT